MNRYYFDILDGDAIAPDEEGVLLPDIHAARGEAVSTLVEVLKDRILESLKGDALAIEVRDAAGPVLQARISFEMIRQKQ